MCKIRLVLDESLQRATPSPVSLPKKDFALRHSISPRTIDLWRQRGLPWLAIGPKKILIPVGAGDAWVTEQFLVSAQRRKPSGYVPRTPATPESGATTEGEAKGVL